MTNERKLELDHMCGQFRKDVTQTLYDIQTGHFGGSFSVCEILTALYFEKADIDPQRPAWGARDRIVLSKGHAAPMAYRVLAERGYFPVDEMKTLRQLDTRLQGHPCANETPGIDITSGPLGLGLAAALGIALGLRLNKCDAYVYAILGDGEIQEGVVWEAAMSASKFMADHLIAILDYNGVQLDGTNDEIMPLLSVKGKFEAFGWRVLECGGHDIAAICDAMDEAKATKDVPVLIIAHTVKGKGVSFMEGKNAWHGKPMNTDEYKAAMAELGGVPQ